MATPSNIKSHLLVAMVTAQLSKPEVCVSVVITSLLLICLFRQQVKDVQSFSKIYFLSVF